MKPHSRHSSIVMPWNWHVREMFCGLFCALLMSGTARAQAVRLKDHTDWWSINNEDFRRGNVKAGTGIIQAGTFEIVGVALGKDQFKSLASKLGSATVVERGDASTGRQQVCYVAADPPKSAYLIFEFGEDENVYYLFRNGPPWSGHRLCTTSKLVSLGSSTASGLRLGLTQDQVGAVLGKPDATSKDRLVYSREIREKTTPDEFSRIRGEYPEKLTDALAHQKFDFYSVEVYIEARFGTSGLDYLAVSKSGDED